MADAKIEMTGTSPLVLNNIRLADPADPYSKKIAALVARSKGRSSLTEEETQEKEFLEWRGSFYENADGQPVLPGTHLKKSLWNIAKRERLGSAVERSVILVSFEGIISYDGPDNIDKLWELPEFRFRAVVNKNPTAAKPSMLPFTRPMFRQWSTELIVSVDTTGLEIEQFENTVHSAGKYPGTNAGGVGNARALGYGAFNADITWL